MSGLFFGVQSEKVLPADLTGEVKGDTSAGRGWLSLSARAVAGVRVGGSASFTRAPASPFSSAGDDDLAGDAFKRTLGSISGVKITQSARKKPVSTSNEEIKSKIGLILKLKPRPADARSAF